MSKPVKDTSINIPNDILKELLTLSEIRMLKNRWHIIKLLDEGLSIRRIAAEVGVGTDTVVRTIRMTENSNTLSKSAKKSVKPIKSSTPWIFGKTE